MIEDIKKDADERMGKSVESLRNDLVKIRTGRAHPSLLDQVQVDYYGSMTPLNQVANISVPDARSLGVQPWEKPMVPAIEKAILNSGLGLNPVTTGDLIRIPLPPLSEERRRELIRLVKKDGEGGRVAVRNIRRDAISDLKELQKEGEITEDDLRKSEEQVQKLTDKHVSEIDTLLDTKEQELLEI